MTPYEKNSPAITTEEQHLLATFKVAIVGCGGLGGYLLEYLCRIGFIHLTLIDGDRFQLNNLNRQLLSHTQNQGTPKVLAGKTRCSLINNKTQITLYDTYLTEDNGSQLLSGHDIVFDGVDHIATRFIIEKTCCHLGIPLIHGAIQGWVGQVATILPTRPLLHKIYPTDVSDQIGPSLSFTPGLIASYQVAEGVKLLLGKGTSLQNELLHVNLLHHRTTKIALT